MAHILIVEDEPAIAQLIGMYLKQAGHLSDWVDDGKLALEQIITVKPDMVLLDIMLPKMDGFEVMRHIRPLGVPTIFLSAKDTLPDKVGGLNLGADDYITKPFEALELLSRIDAVLRRTMPKTAYKVLIGELEICLDEHVVRKAGETVDLTVREFELLSVLLRNQNIALSRDRLLELAWGYEYMGETRTVDVHIQRLRQKLDLENHLKTVYKVGYRLEV